MLRLGAGRKDYVTNLSVAGVKKLNNRIFAPVIDRI
jgi:hypothetical protein